MIVLNKTSIPTPIKPQLHNVKLHALYKEDFLQEVLEALGEGFLILTIAGELVYNNASAYQICCQLNQGNLNTNFLPSAIWQLCETLLESRNFCSDQLMMLSDEIVLNHSTVFRIKVKLLHLERFQFPCLLVTIENRCESLKNIAIAEIQKYALTRREAEIWCLYRGKYSYKEIAAQLYITVNTVKKHMKNIHAKRQYFVEINS